MNYEKELYNRLKKLAEANESDKEKFVYELYLSKKLIEKYENRNATDLNVFLAVLSDFDIKMNKDTSDVQIRRTDEINGLKKLVFANTLYNKFNLTNKQITEVLGCSRASVKYYLENHETKKKYNAVRYNILLSKLNEILAKYKL